MKLTATILALLPLACTAHLGIQRHPKRPEQHTWDNKLDFLNPKYYLQPDRPTIHHEKRDADIEKRQNVPPIEQGEDFQFLPPPYDPCSSHLKLTYPLSDVSAYDDSGRAQMFDNMPPDMQLWGSCPPYGLDCNRCPRDKRCWVYPSNSAPMPLPYPISSTTDGALPEIEGTCPLHTCKNDLTSTWSCGRNAKCSKGHCVCQTGFKGADKSVRGFDDLSKVTVWVDVGTDCDVQCDNFLCGEVEQVSACFHRYESGVVVPQGVEGESEHVDVLEASQMGGSQTTYAGGAVNANIVPTTRVRSRAIHNKDN
jgi:hypothetical protein